MRDTRDDSWLPKHTPREDGPRLVAPLWQLVKGADVRTAALYETVTGRQELRVEENGALIYSMLERRGGSVIDEAKQLRETLIAQGWTETF